LNRDFIYSLMASLRPYLPFVNIKRLTDERKVHAWKNRIASRLPRALNLGLVAPVTWTPHVSSHRRHRLRCGDLDHPQRHDTTISQGHAVSSCIGDENLVSGFSSSSAPGRSSRSTHQSFYDQPNELGEKSGHTIGYILIIAQCNGGD